MFEDLKVISINACRYKEVEKRAKEAFGPIIEKYFRKHGNERRFSRLASELYLEANKAKVKDSVYERSYACSRGPIVIFRLTRENDEIRMRMESMGDKITIDVTHESGYHFIEFRPLEDGKFYEIYVEEGSFDEEGFEEDEEIVGYICGSSLISFLRVLYKDLKEDPEKAYKTLAKFFEASNKRCLLFDPKDIEPEYREEAFYEVIPRIKSMYGSYSKSRDPEILEASYGFLKEVIKVAVSRS